jgi:hypothetical protein
MKFNSLKEKLRYIQAWNQFVIANERKKEKESDGKYTPIYPDLAKALRACKRKHYVYYGSSKYMPHQGVAERERRREK